MADMATAVNSGDGIAYLVSAGIVYEIIAASCSSPQTAEINAKQRSDTLMKWVHIGIVQAAIFIAIGAYIDRKHRLAIIGGGVTAAVLMYAQYVHALQAGMSSDAPGTEN